MYLSLKCDTLSLNLHHRRKDLAPACVIIQSLVLFSLFSSKLAWNLFYCSSRWIIWTIKIWTRKLKPVKSTELTSFSHTSLHPLYLRDRMDLIKGTELAILGKEELTSMVWPKMSDVWVIKNRVSYSLTIWVQLNVFNV